MAVGRQRGDARTGASKAQFGVAARYSVHFSRNRVCAPQLLHAQRSASAPVRQVRARTKRQRHSGGAACVVAPNQSPPPRSGQCAAVQEVRCAWCKCRSVMAGGMEVRTARMCWHPIGMRCVELRRPCPPPAPDHARPFTLPPRPLKVRVYPPFVFRAANQRRPRAARRRVVRCACRKMPRTAKRR